MSFNDDVPFLRNLSTAADHGRLVEDMRKALDDGTADISGIIDGAEMRVEHKADSGPTAVEYKPVHGGYPTPRLNKYQPLILGDGGKVVQKEVPSLVDAMTMSERLLDPVGGHGDDWGMSDQRKAGFNYGSGWQGPYPPIYFDAVRLSTALDQIVHDATVRAWSMTTILRNLRLAETALERKTAINDLIRVYGELLNPDVELRMHINDLANTIDNIAPITPKGYQPTMGIQYAVKPLRDIIAKIRATIGRIGS